MGSEPESAGLGRGVPVGTARRGGQRGTRRPSGRPPRHPRVLPLLSLD